MHLRLLGRATALAALLATGFLSSLRAQETAASPGAGAITPMRWEIEVTSGVLWKFGGTATPLTYTFAPQIISFKIPPINQWPWAGGTLMLRSRFSLLLEPIVNGPEHHFFGVAAAGEAEWRTHDERFAFFFASGGGFGWLDSKGYQIAGAQGQDFNLNWLVHTGVRYQPKKDWLISAGVYFQHISNKGMNKVNPGVNAIGPKMGRARRVLGGGGKG